MILEAVIIKQDALAQLAGDMLGLDVKSQATFRVDMRSQRERGTAFLQRRQVLKGQA